MVNSEQDKLNETIAMLKQEMETQKLTFEKEIKEEKDKCLEKEVVNNALMDKMMAEKV